MREHAAGLQYTPSISEGKQKIGSSTKRYSHAKDALYIFSTALALTGGLIGGAALEINKRPPQAPETPQNQFYDPTAVSQPQVLYEATIAADVHAFLFPSPTPTKEPTAIPIPSNVPIATAPLPNCLAVTPVVGERCALPNAYFGGETPTPIPPPSCAQALADPTAWARVWSRTDEDCMWTGPDPTPIPQGIEVPIGNPPILPSLSGVIGIS